MSVILSSRHKNLQTVRSTWAREGVKVSCCDLLQVINGRLLLLGGVIRLHLSPQNAMDAAVSMNDLSITVDVLNILNLLP